MADRSTKMLTYYLLAYCAALTATAHKVGITHNTLPGHLQALTTSESIICIGVDNVQITGKTELKTYLAHDMTGKI